MALVNRLRGIGHLTLRHIEWRRSEIELRSGSPQLFGSDRSIDVLKVDSYIKNLTDAFENQKRETGITLDGFSCWLQVYGRTWQSHNNNATLEAIFGTISDIVDATKVTQQVDPEGTPLRGAPDL